MGLTKRYFIVKDASVYLFHHPLKSMFLVQFVVTCILQLKTCQEKCIIIDSLNIDITKSEFKPKLVWMINFSIVLSFCLKENKIYKILPKRYRMVIFFLKYWII